MILLTDDTVNLNRNVFALLKYSLALRNKYKNNIINGAPSIVYSLDVDQVLFDYCVLQFVVDKCNTLYFMQTSVVIHRII